MILRPLPLSGQVSVFAAIFPFLELGAGASQSAHQNVTKCCTDNSHNFLMNHTAQGIRFPQIP